MSNIKIEYLQKYGLGKVFVETGTYLGDTVQLALDAGFDLIHTIEVDQGMFNKCQERFKNNNKVKLWFGDSVDFIPKIVDGLTSPATFWLDAHASGPLAGGRYARCPLVLELEAIYVREKLQAAETRSEEQHEKSSIDSHTIMIDDRRLFGSAEWGFVQEKEIMDLLFAINPNYNIHYLDGHQPNDIICATVK
ncbi:MAG: hypothetical protein RLZZ337_667 [Bacteroidota bacterium]|jgi:hypothetical protein